MRFEGKTAIVTGGSNGIGRACVTRLAAEGARVAMVDFCDLEVSQGVVDELKDLPGEIIPFQADVRDADRATELVNQLFDKWERLDVLINSAGIVRDGLMAAMTQQFMGANPDGPRGAGDKKRQQKERQFSWRVHEAASPKGEANTKYPARRR